jgi:hypothetical protein
MTTSSFDLPKIPVVDVRDGGPVRHAREGAGRALALRDDCLSWFPPGARYLVPLLDMLSKQWLARSRSPYVREVRTIAGMLGFPGVWFLNGSYQWSCTALAREEDEVPWLARTLDWPFPGLGRHVEVARMRGEAGEFLNITWPGYVGVLTACAPGRFAAAINQAPMWRRTHHPWLRLYDLAANAAGTLRHVRHMPPDQLLREAFETCRDFGEARRKLETTPVARPVIYTLAGCRPGERCVIERTEDNFLTRGRDASAANDWFDSNARWEARIGSQKLLSCSFADAAANSQARREALNGWSGSFARDGFSWVSPPVLNPYTRIAAEMCPARGALRVVGYEIMHGSDLPQPATSRREIAADLAMA